MDIFHILPWNITLTLLITLAVALAVAVFCLIRKYTDQALLRQDHEVASYNLNIIALFYCLLISLVVIDVQDDHKDVRDTSIKEASILLNLYTTSSVLPEIDREDIKQGIRNYISYTLDQEWAMLEAGKDLSLVPPIHAHSLWRIFSDFEPKSYRQLALYQDLLNRMNQLEEARFKRLNSVQGSATPFLWAILIYGGLIVIGCTFVFASKSKTEHIMFIVFNVSFLTLVLLLIYCLDSPFTGPTAIEITPFKQVLEQIDGIDMADGYQINASN